MYTYYGDKIRNRLKRDDHISDTVSGLVNYRIIIMNWVYSNWRYQDLKNERGCRSSVIVQKIYCL